jgi:hypothetical protein
MRRFDWEGIPAVSEGGPGSAGFIFRESAGWMARDPGIWFDAAEEISSDEFAKRFPNAPPSPIDRQDGADSNNAAA